MRHTLVAARITRVGDTRMISIAALVSLGLVLPFVNDAGPARQTIDGPRIRVLNNHVNAEWQAGPQGLKLVKLRDGLNDTEFTWDSDAFALVLKSGRRVRSSEMTLVQPPRGEVVMPVSGVVCRADQTRGATVTAVLRDDESGISVAWRAILRDDTHFIRQEVTLSAEKEPVAINEVVLIDLPAPTGRVTGSCLGSPITTDKLFLAVEHPMSRSSVNEGRATCLMPRVLPLRPGATASYSSVMLVARPGQMRRAVLRYVEMQRAHPYRPFLHYNSWYDLGMFTPFNEKECVETIQTFSRELVEKRGVRIDSFLFDDGWDNYESVWEFHSGFPNGFTPLKQAAARAGAAPGVWLSPWGGYGKPREQRLAHGKSHGMEVDAQGYALSGPKYYARFQQVTRDFVTTYGVNQFKFDGTGSPDKTYESSAFDSDFDAAISLITELRRLRPDLFINLTTGTWPSPFWLRYADSTWRGGHDHSFTGKGADRQRWITYRDADTFRGVVQRGPLYPLNSLMLHGLIYAKHANKLNSDPNGDFRDEVRSYFGSGTQLQEMYISPALLTPRDWDDLAEAAKWSRSNADVLVDTHWIGGDPEKSDVYGWASWSPRKGIVVLRNPSDQSQTFALDIDAAFELPPGAPRAYQAQSPFASDAGRAELNLTAGKPATFELKPFEVIVLEAAPKSQ